MTNNTKKQEIITQIISLLTQLAENEERNSAASPATQEPVEMLTVKECSEAFKGLSEHTVRQLVAQKRIPFIRTGQGRNGKILIPKAALSSYLGGNAV